MTRRVRKYGWPAEDSELLREMWLAGHSIRFISAKLHRGKTSVGERAERMGLLPRKRGAAAKSGAFHHQHRVKTAPKSLGPLLARPSWFDEPGLMALCSSRRLI